MKGALDHHCFCIPITCGKDECPPWCLIELQGELEVQEDSDSATFPVGTLCQSSFKGDALSLTVGNHQLEGKKVALKKPFAILDPEELDESGHCQSYKVIGVLHDKYLFKTRPRPLISKPDSSRKR
ncbi:hypothetical protein WJX82_001537 [Trebouxia sp. C0006]